MTKIRSHRKSSVPKQTKIHSPKKAEKSSKTSSSSKPPSSNHAGHTPTHKVSKETQANTRARVVHDTGANHLQHTLNQRLNANNPQPLQTPPSNTPPPTATPSGTPQSTSAQDATTPAATATPIAAPTAPAETGAVATPAAQEPLPPAQYPDAVNNVVNVDEFLNNVQIPPDIQAQGPDAVNAHKLKELSTELHNHIYDTNGDYRRNPPPPFNDADAVQTIYTAAADLSKRQTLEENPRPTTGPWANRTDEEWAQSPQFHDQWVEKFVPLASSGVNGTDKKFGDYGWNPLYQDGSSSQSTHFQLAMNGTHMLGPARGLAWLGNIQHEYQGAGPSVQDFLNSQLAVRMTSQLATDNQYSPEQFAQDWGSNIRTGEPFASMNLSNPFNVPELLPILGLPQAEISPGRYP